MDPKMNKLSRLLILVTAILIGLSCAHAATYSITDLGTLGGLNSGASDINMNGAVVGYASLADGSRHAFIYHDGRMRDLGTLGGLNSEAAAINSNGDVVGWSDIADGSEHAFVYHDGTMHDLGTLGGLNSTANDINDNGQIVGTSNAIDGSRRAFLYSDGVMRNIDTLGQYESTASGINNKGQIVGEYRTSSSLLSMHAFCFGERGMEDMGIPSLSIAYHIDDNGTIIGMHDFQGFVYVDGICKGFDPVWCDLNAAGQMVGIQLTNTAGRATLLSSGAVIDLNDLIESGFNGLLYGASGMNDNGQIVGSALYGDTLDRTMHAYVLTPIPEPSAMTLFGGISVGALVLAWQKHMRRHAGR
jgi:probable HAF family extracellular repeat protein